MKTTLFFSLITAFAFSALPPALAQEPSWKGSGLPDDPFLIESLDQLIELRDAVNNFPYDASQFPYIPVSKPFKGAHFLLTTDIDLAPYNDAHPEGWTPIGFNSKSTYSRAFYGHFKGGGHVIKNLKSKGLFVALRGATISDLGLPDVDITGGMHVGALTGFAVAEEYLLPNWEVILDTPTTISNCYVTGKVTGHVTTGGLVGYLRQSTVSNCFADCEVYETGMLRAATTGQRGILIGLVYSGSTVNNSYATGSIYSFDNATGGLAGGIHNGGNIYNCYADVILSTSFVSVLGEGQTVASGGGILGDNNSEYGRVSNCVVLGDFTSQKEYTHPVVGAQWANSLRNNYISSNVFVNGEPFLAADKNSASGETVDHQLLFSAGFYSDPDNWSPSDAASNPLPSAWSLSPQDDSRSIWNIWEGKSLPYFQYQSAPPLISSLSDASLSGEYRTDDYAALEYIAVSVNGQHLGNAQFDDGGNWAFTFPSSRTVGDKISVTVKEYGKAISYSLRAVIPSKDLKEPNPPMAIQSPLSPIDTDACSVSLFTLTGAPVLSANPPAGIYLRRFSHPSLGSRTQKIVLNGR
jgi:hypothetical protein